jgi:protein-tyrosine phosphatase
MFGTRGATGLIDLHCHILPQLDDGALDLEDAVAMARQAENDGLRRVCATPHIRHDHDVRIAELATRVADLNAELRRRDVRVAVATGGEVAETAARSLSDEELDAVSLGGGRRWILLEPAPGHLGDSFGAAVDELARRGYRTVIAHPERHAGADVETRLAALCAGGALVQVTAAMLEHDHASAMIVRLAERGLVHVLGSDSHSSRAGRPVRLSPALAALRAIPRLEPHIEWIAEEAPHRLLAGLDVEPPF